MFIEVHKNPKSSNLDVEDYTLMLQNGNPPLTNILLHTLRSQISSILPEHRRRTVRVVRIDTFAFKGVVAACIAIVQSFPASNMSRAELENFTLLCIPNISTWPWPWRNEYGSWQPLFVRFNSKLYQKILQIYVLDSSILGNH